MPNPEVDSRVELEWTHCQPPACSERPLGPGDEVGEA